MTLGKAIVPPGRGESHGRKAFDKTQGKNHGGSGGGVGRGQRQERMDCPVLCLFTSLI